MLLQTAQPQASLYGILSPAVTLVTEDSLDWLTGFNYETTDGDVEVSIEALSDADSAANHVIVSPTPDSPSIRTYIPFDIRASVKLSTFGVKPEDVQASTEHALETVTQKAIETEFWTGRFASALTTDNDNRYLSHADAVDVTPTPGTAVKVRYGQALLEQALGNATIGSTGVIHAPLLIASVLQASDQDGALTTNLGTKVVAGAGYSNTGPDGAVAPTGTAWVYATGPVTVRLGPVPTVTPEKLGQAVNIGNNTIQFYVDRPAAVTWSTTPLYAVLVDLALDYA